MENDGVKDEPVKDEKIESDAKTIASTETEQIKIDEEKIKKIESLEEEEEELK